MNVGRLLGILFLQTISIAQRYRNCFPPEPRTFARTDGAKVPFNFHYSLQTATAETHTRIRLADLGDVVEDVRTVFEKLGDVKIYIPMLSTRIKSSAL